MKTMQQTDFFMDRTELALHANTIVGRENCVLLLSLAGQDGNSAFIFA